MKLIHLTPLLALVTLFWSTTPLLVAPSHPVDLQDRVIGPSDTGLFGQDHFYTIIFRADGGAITYGRVTVGNTAEQPLERLALTIPKGTVTSFEAFQEIPGQEVCPLFEQQKPGIICPYFGNPTYRKADASQENQTFTIKLPDPVDKDSTGTIVLGYRATGYSARQSLGLFTFDLETPTTGETMRSVTVSLDVDSDLYLRSKVGRVVYKSTGISDTPLTAESAPRLAATIGYGGQFIKTGQGLAPGETLRVQGSFATNRYVLFWKEFLIGFAVLVAILLALRWWRRGHQMSFGGPMTPENTLLALVGALGVVGLTYLWQLLLNMTGTYSGGPVGLLFGILIAFLYIALLTGPAVVTGARRGWTHGLYVLIAEFVFLLILAIFLSIVWQGPPEAIPVYPLRGMLNSPS